MSVNCNVCGSPARVTLIDRAMGMYRCGACRHTFKNIPLHDQERYDESYFTDAHKNWFSHPDRALFEYIFGKTKELLGPRPVRIIDVGCGEGSFLKYVSAKKSGAELYGIDLTTNDSPEFRFIRGNIMKDKIDGTYDVVTSLAVIEHVDDPGALVRKMAALVAPGGLLFVMTDDDGGMIYSIARLMKKLGIRQPYEQLYELHHLHCFTRRSLKKLMEDNGFDVVDHRNHNYPVAGVDMPKSGAVMELIFRAGVRCIFSVSSLLGNGILQTVVCRKKAVS